ncbi:DUF4190 domain-containing protein [Solwaraspora sp. WMMD406]|uniref:DUF4190 domain-containing protein n=1 Tax=Solwaraspora sp. WMMD406 TaxID=3016095 RepID=UPI002417E6FE|nr:DUF4190 domain-containing protein [Solwaraspora sp. WMMD406]MDG4768125.1 DUF4190 domain-containing protein [Solwaraspora sp. WMMD406]
MSNPPPPGNWSDPSWPGQPASGQPDPAGPVSGQPGYGYGYPDPGYSQSGAPEAYPGYPPAYPGQPGPGYPPPYPGHPGGYGYPMPPPMPMNGRAIAAMVMGIIGILALCGYLAPGLIGIVGALLGHSARRQIRDRAAQGRPEQGEGLALAGMITGWIAFGIGLAGTVVIAIAIAISVSQS